MAKRFASQQEAYAYIASLAGGRADAYKVSQYLQYAQKAYSVSAIEHSVMSAHDFGFRGMITKKWKVVSKKYEPTTPQQELRPSKDWGPCTRGDYYRQDESEAQEGPALSGYQIQSVGNILWKDIPDNVKEENGAGWRFIKLEDHITAEHFEFEEIEL